MFERMFPGGREAWRTDNQILRLAQAKKEADDAWKQRHIETATTSVFFWGFYSDFSDLEHPAACCITFKLHFYLFVLLVFSFAFLLFHFFPEESARLKLHVARSWTPRGWTNRWIPKWASLEGCWRLSTKGCPLNRSRHDLDSLDPIPGTACCFSCLRRELLRWDALAVTGRMSTIPMRDNWLTSCPRSKPTKRRRPCC